MNNLAPILFVDFDGALHVGNTYIGEDDCVRNNVYEPPTTLTSGPESR